MPTRLILSVLVSLAIGASCSPREPSVDCSSKLTVATSMLQIMKSLDEDIPYDKGAILRAVGLLNHQTWDGDFTLEQIQRFCGLNLKGLEELGKQHQSSRWRFR